MPNFQVITAVNNDKILKENLLLSPMIKNNSIPVFLAKDYKNAGPAYNTGIQQNSKDVNYSIFAHQDVYFPEGWDKRLLKAINQLEQENISWGILGVWGIKASGHYIGKVWCSGGGVEHFGILNKPEEVVSIDEIVIVLNMACNIKFDELLPGFHLYATDIILEAKKRGHKSFVFNGPVVHNSKFNPQVFDTAYFNAYKYMKHKWASIVPLQTCVIPVTRFSIPLYKEWARKEVKKRIKKLEPKESQANSEEIALKLGYNL